MRALAGLACVLLLACSSRVGDTCRQHSDCKLEGGYCARVEVCLVGCDDGGACPAATACVDTGARAVCLQTCTSDAACPTGFVCRPRGDAQVCLFADPLAKPE